LAGISTRLIPQSTKSAHQLASSSIAVLTPATTRMEDKYASTKMCGNIKKYKACTYVDKNDFYVESGNERKYSGNTFEAPVSVNKSSSSSDINGVFHPTCSFSALLDDISHQRGQLKPSELDEFDRQWGIDPSGELTRSNRRYWCNVASNTESLMRQELQWVSSEARSKIDKLRIATDEHFGLELLHLFILDLLGRHTPAAHIFCHIRRQVRRGLQTLASGDSANQAAVLATCVRTEPVLRLLFDRSRLPEGNQLADVVSGGLCLPFGDRSAAVRDHGMHLDAVSHPQSRLLRSGTSESSAL